VPEAEPKIVYTPRPDTTLETEFNALAAVYRFILDCHAKKMAAELAPGSDGSNDTAMVRNLEGVGHVGQRPNRTSETT